MWVLDRKNFATGTTIYWDRYRRVDGKWLIDTFATMAVGPLLDGD